MLYIEQAREWEWERVREFHSRIFVLLLEIIYVYKSRPATMQRKQSG